MGKNLVDLGFVRMLAPVALALVMAGLPAQLAGLPSGELTTVRSVRALTPDQASQARPVRLRGVVTVLSGWKTSFFFQDATAGISVNRSSDSPAIQSGQQVEIRGVTGPGSFAPLIVAQSVTLLGKGKLPPARLFGLEQLAGGKQDSQWLAMRGIVRSAVVKPSWGRPVLFLEIDIGGGNLVTVRVHDFSETGLDRLPASTVSVRGVCGTVFNDKRQFVGLRLFVASLDDVHVEQPAPAKPFDIPIRPLDSLLQFGDRTGAIQRIRVRGIVTYSQPGRGLYLQDGTQGVFVQSGQSTPVALGSLLEAVGYPAAGRYSPKLDDAVFRVVGAAQPPAGLMESASAMIVDKEGFPAAPYDSILVQLKGRLVEQIPGPDQDLLLLQDGATIFTAKLAQSGYSFRAPAAGSLVSLTGICAADADEAHEARSFELLLRSPADLVMLENAPWWTASRAAWVVLLLALVILGMAVWLAAVRRQALLHALTVTDPLTGLLNRRGFLLLAEQQWKLSQRNKTSLILFYIDLDRFKEINDLLGHKEGDLALQTVATLLRESFRKSDILGRLGGDEFAVAAIDAHPDARPTLEQRLARAVEQDNDTSDKPYQLLLSTGVLACDVTLATLSIEDLLAKADALMYEQKRTRKRRGTHEISQSSLRF
jgi:diguanylate cyclase (GGDEF)-like protein